MDVDGSSAMDVDGSSAVTIVLSRAEAAKQILVVSIGLALTSAIFEHLKIWPENLLNFIFLAIFILYATRFFVNNWIYVSESYDPGKINKLPGQDVRSMILNVRTDLILCLVTGIMIDLASMMTQEDRLRPLMICLILHYAFDSLVLILYLSKYSTATETSNQKKRAKYWLINNTIFMFICVALLAFSMNVGVMSIVNGLLVMSEKVPITAMAIMLFFWASNCGICSTPLV